MRNLKNILLAILIMSGSQAYAGKIVLKIKAGNPIDTPQPAEIRSDLPVGIGTNEIISIGELEIGYDVKKDIYFVHKEVQLGPKEVKNYDVEIKDIWVVPDDEIAALQQKAGELAKMLEKSQHADVASGVQKAIDETLNQVKTRQADNVIKAGNVIQHIAAYEKSVKELKRVKMDVGHLENLVLSSGSNPGALVGDDKDAPKINRNVKMATNDYKTAVIKITVYNTSPTETREIPVKHDLPPEIAADDVLETEGDLKVGTDFKRGITYVYKDDLEIGPNTNIIFDVKIRDKWNVNMARIPALRKDATNLLQRISAMAKYKPIEESLTNLITKLDEFEAEKGPTTLNAAYVAYYRKQAERVDLVEERINRIKAVLKPIEGQKLGFKAKAPSPKSTWLIIYVILGFLAIMSLLFFLRWYGKGKDEILAASGGGSGESGTK